MKRNWSWEDVAGGLLIAVLVGGMGTVGARAYIEERTTNRMKSCQENLTKIDGAKEQWALENNLSPGALPVVADLAPSGGAGYLKAFPSCPSGHAYVIHPVGTDPVCPSGLPGHALSEVGAVIICELE